jgi:hypothetical protein
MKWFPWKKHNLDDETAFLLAHAIKQSSDLGEAAEVWTHGLWQDDLYDCLATITKGALSITRENIWRKGENVHPYVIRGSDIDGGPFEIHLYRIDDEIADRLDRIGPAYAVKDRENLARKRTMIANEASNIFEKTGLSPRQLAEQVEALREVLEPLAFFAAKQRPGNIGQPDWNGMASRAQAALAATARKGGE